MAEIIGYDKTKMKQFTCKECGAIVLYGKPDIKEYHGKDYSGGSAGQEWVDCPGCKCEHVLRSW